MPHLVDRIREDEREVVWSLISGLHFAAMGIATGQTEDDFLGYEFVQTLPPFLHALYQIGPQALPEVSRLLASEDQQRLKVIPEALEQEWHRRVKRVVRRDYAGVVDVESLESLEPGVSEESMGNPRRMIREGMVLRPAQSVEADGDVDSAPQ